MVLQGCGGDDNNGGISAEDQARLDVLDALEDALPEGQELTVAYLVALLGDAEDLDDLEAVVPMDESLTVQYLMSLIGDAEALENLDVPALMAELAKLPDTMQLNAATIMTLVDAYNENKEAEADEAAETAKKVADALLGELTGVMLLDADTMAPAVMVSSEGKLTAEATGYDMADMYPDMIDGLRGAMLTKRRETIVVYTDRMPAEAMTFSTRYNSERVDNKMVFNIVVTGARDNDLEWSDVMRDDNSHMSSTVGDPPMTTVSFTGMVDGVAGTFSCTGDTACAVPARVDGGGVAETTNTADYSFVPDDANAMVDVQNDDGHLVLGWWLSKDADGVPSGVDVFATAMNLGLRDDTSGNVTASGATLTGTATYEGSAVGKYALHNVAGTGNSEAGHFTADAMLEADFDANTAAAGADPNENGIMLSGMIDSIMTGEMARDWTVKLSADSNGADTAGTPGFDNLDDISVGSTLTAEWQIGTATAMGTWDAEFWGQADEDTAADNHPTAVTGEFMAGFDDIGHIIGAFGATADE
jgi:hypothetical protein